MEFCFPHPFTLLLSGLCLFGGAIIKVEDGAMVIDINLDDGLLDGLAAMQKFCKIAVTEPDVSKVGIPFSPPCCLVHISCHAL